MQSDFPLEKHSRPNHSGRGENKPPSPAGDALAMDSATASLQAPAVGEIKGPSRPVWGFLGEDVGRLHAALPWAAPSEPVSMVRVIQQGTACRHVCSHLICHLVRRDSGQLH